MASTSRWLSVKPRSAHQGTIMRRISRVEHAARQLALRTITPICLDVADRTTRLAETRFRRSFAIQRHVRGDGIEVGAAAAPALVPLRARVKYVDKYDVRGDPELAGLAI